MASKSRVILIWGGILLLATCGGILGMLRGCDKPSPQAPLIAAVEITYDPQETVDESSHIIASFPDCAPAFHNRDMSYRLLGDYSKAIDDLTQAIKLQPYADYVPYTYLQRGVAYAQLGELNNSLRDLNKSLSLDGSIGRAYYTRGEIYLATGNRDEAVTNYMRARQNGVSHPLYSRASINVSLLHAENGEVDRPMKEFAILERDYPGDPQPFFARGRVLFGLGEYYSAMNNCLHGFLLAITGCGLNYRWELMPNEAYMYEPHGLSWQRLLRIVDHFERWRLKVYGTDDPHRPG